MSTSILMSNILLINRQECHMSLRHICSDLNYVIKILVTHSLKPSWLNSLKLVIRWDLEAQRQMINHWSLLSVAPPLETPWRRPSKPHGAAPRNPCAAPRNPMAPCLETPGAPRLKTPGDKIWDQNFQVSVVFRPFWPKWAIPHPIIIQIWDLGNRKFFGGGSL